MEYGIQSTTLKIDFEILSLVHQIEVYVTTIIVINNNLYG